MKQALLGIAGGSTKRHNLYLTILVKITHKSTYPLTQQSQFWEFIPEIHLPEYKMKHGQGYSLQPCLLYKGMKTTSSDERPVHVLT